MSAIKSFNDFRKEVKEKIQEIYQEEQSVLAIEVSHSELQDLVEQYDEDFSKPYLDILGEEVDLFKQKHNR